MAKEIQVTLERIIDVLVKEYQPEKIILFGSCAYGQPHEESDIDLLIIRETDKPFHKRWAEVYSLVSEIVRGLDFSPFVITPEELQRKLEKRDPFFEEILTRGEVLYGTR